MAEGKVSKKLVQQEKKDLDASPSKQGPKSVTAEKQLPKATPKTQMWFAS